jgi:transposase-like protein
MNPQQQFCHNEACHASGQIGQGNIIIHSRQAQRYRCTCCGTTFSERKGTAVEGVKKSAELFVLVITLLSYGCPVQAIVVAFGLDERTVRSWLLKAGRHSQGVHAHLVRGSQLDLEQVQADEIKAKSQAGTLWVAMAIMVRTRLWLGGALSPQRDQALIRTLVAQVRQVALCRPLLLAVDGFASYVSVFQAAFRSPLRLGEPGRPKLIAWSTINIVQVVKHRCTGVLAIERRIVQGANHQVTQLLRQSQGDGVINTAFIERLNATFRQRIHSLARRTRSLVRTQQTLQASMFLLGCVYNFCTEHASLRLPRSVAATAQALWLQRTPAMTAGLTDHCWTVAELLLFKVPVPYQPPKRRGRPPKLTCSCGLL